MSIAPKLSSKECIVAIKAGRKDDISFCLHKPWCYNVKAICTVLKFIDRCVERRKTQHTRTHSTAPVSELDDEDLANVQKKVGQIIVNAKAQATLLPSVIKRGKWAKKSRHALKLNVTCVGMQQLART
jgi:hypothetical protein